MSAAMQASMNAYPVLTTMPARQSYFRNPSPFYQGPMLPRPEPLEGETVVVRVRKARPAAETVLARVAVPVTREGKLSQWRAELARAKAKGLMTPARAAKLRARGRELCGCILCQWGSAPATTPAEHAERMADCERRNVAGAWDDCLFRTFSPAPTASEGAFAGDAWGPAVESDMWEYVNFPSWARHVSGVAHNNPFRRLA